MGTDIISGCGALAGFVVVGSKSKWTRRHAGDAVKSLWYRDLREFLYSILILLLCVLGFLSSLASIYSLIDSKFSEIGGWYVGCLCWIMGRSYFLSESLNSLLIL